MTTGQTNTVLPYLCWSALLPDGEGLTDGQLLDRFNAGGDSAAFAALVRRHGRMVWGVCRRQLLNPQDAEDAFQATFLVLVRKAANIGQKELVGVTFLSFTPDGKTLVTGGSDNGFKIWDWDGKGTLKERHSVEAGQHQGLYGMTLSPDGKILAVTCDSTIKLYDVTTGKQRDGLEEKDGARTAWDQVTFSPDGKTVASCSWIQERDGDFMVQKRGVIRLWDVATGKVRDTVAVKGVVESLAFAPDGRTLAAGCRGTLKFPAGEQLKPGDIEEEKDGPVILLTVQEKRPGD